MSEHALPGPHRVAPPRPVPAAPAGATQDAAAPDAPHLGTATLVDTALAHLDGLDDRVVTDHVAAYDAVHRGLQDALATLDEA